jgi:hypothetical protein
MIRQYENYQSALTCAFEEEVQGIAYFAVLAAREQGPARDALHLMAQIEERLVADLSPLMQRHHFPHAPFPDLLAQGRAEAAAENPWPKFLRVMAEDYDDYLAEFQQLHDTAPPDDRALMRRLINHELALIAFARAERAGDPDAPSLLRNFLHAA